MMLLSLHDYLPLDDLAQIFVAVIAVAFLAPSAVSLAIVGLDRRDHGEVGSGNTMLAIGVGGLLILLAIGLYALVSK